jgi:hypothetical protein
MTKDDERRYVERIFINGALVIFKELKKINFFHKYSPPHRLVNLNKSGLSFEADHKISPGLLMFFKIIIPGERKICLKGRTAWIAAKQKMVNYLAGIQFLPFGKGKQYNSFLSHDKLQRLITKYSN